MAFTHLMNCFVLTYGPIYAIYSGSRMYYLFITLNDIISYRSDFSSGKLMGKSMLYYIAFAMTKMLLYATIIPFNSQEGDSNNLSQDIIKNLINALEISFLYYCLQMKNNYSDNETGLKVLTISLAWSFADSLCSNLFYFLLNATGEEFTWEYIQTSIIANIDFIEKIGIAAVVECILKLNNEKKWNLHLVLLLIGKYCFNGLGYKYIKQLQFDSSWEKLICKGVIALMFVVVCKFVFHSIIKDENALAEEAYMREMKNKKVQ